MGNKQIQSRDNRTSSKPDPSELSFLIQILAQDNDTILEETLQGHLRLESSPTHIIDEMVLVDQKHRWNLLQLAVIMSARKCVHILVNKPYSWNPDRLDSCGWTAMHMAEGRDDLRMFYSLAEHSKEKRNCQPRDSIHVGIRSISTCIIWPQDAVLSPLVPEDFRERVSPEIRGTQTDMAKLCGRSIALLYELLLANPELADSSVIPNDTDLSSSSSNDSKDSRQSEAFHLWPIKPVDNVFLNHSSECCEYPDCLQVDWSNSPDHEEEFQLVQVFNIWKTHRFCEKKWTDASDRTGHFIWTPPRLKDYCRISLRRLLVNRVVPYPDCPRDHIFHNYVRLINTLRLPRDLCDFIAFRELWPIDTTRISIEFGRRRCIEATFPNIGRGVLVNHGFIPE